MNSPVYLNALRAFEASARHKSFSAAAKELNVTPAAVGQLVRTLEDWLGFPLFHRQTNGKIGWLLPNWLSRFYRIFGRVLISSLWLWKN